MARFKPRYFLQWLKPRYFLHRWGVQLMNVPKASSTIMDYFLCREGESLCWLPKSTYWPYDHAFSWKYAVENQATGIHNATKTFQIKSVALAYMSQGHACLRLIYDKHQRHTYIIIESIIIIIIIIIVVVVVIIVIIIIIIVIIIIICLSHFLGVGRWWVWLLLPFCFLFGTFQIFSFFRIDLNFFSPFEISWNANRCTTT